MASRPSMKAEVKKKSVLPTDNALANTSESKKETKKNDSIYIRQTYYIPHELKRAIHIMAAMEGKEKSEVVRELLFKAMPEEYFK